MSKGRPTKKAAAERDRAIKQAAEHEMIRRGHLSWILHKGQKPLYKKWKSSKNKITVLNCARRFGKSFLLMVTAKEHCMQNPKHQVRFAAATQKQVKSIFLPIIDALLSRFPADAMPTHSEGCWTFPNGSKLYVVGADYKDGDALRGQASDLIILDEAGFVKKLRYLVTDILLPQLLTTRGRLIMASTPPKSVAHDFVDYINEAIADNAYELRTVYDNPMLTDKDLLDIYRQCGGKHTDTFRREYMCELISDSSQRIIPEFDLARHVRSLKEPDHYYPLVTMDWGAHDMTAVLFGYVDFQRQVLCIQDEYVINNQTTKIIADGIKAKEFALWSNKRKTPDRFGDNPLQITWDLGREYGLSVKPPLKFEKDVAIANLRDGFLKGKIEIDPRCKLTIFQLQNGTWNDNRTTFERSVALGHCDAIDALIYMFRHANFRANPYPINNPVIAKEFIPANPSNIDDIYQKMFRIKKTY